MNRSSRSILWFVCAAALLLAAGPASAQFIFLAQDEDTITQINSGGTLTLSSEGIGVEATTTLSVQFKGPENSLGTVREPTLEGSTAFSIITGPDLPRLLQPDASLNFLVRFRPTGIGPFTTRLTFRLSQERFGTPTIDTTVVINLVGNAADYTVSYQLTGANEILIPAGGTIEFEDTTVDGSSTALVSIFNRGSGPGTVISAALSGDPAFEATGLRLLPVEVASRGEVRFSIVFSPLERRVHTARLDLTTGAGTRSIQIAAGGVEGTITLRSIFGGSGTDVPRAGTVPLPATKVGEESVVEVRLTNTGDADSDLTALSVSTLGGVYALSNVPLIPQPFPIGRSVGFTLTFKPAEPGIADGQLRVNDVIYTLAGEGLGAQPVYSSIFAGESSQVLAGGSILFPQTAIGGTSTVDFQVRNDGNSPLPISAIGLTGAAFSLDGLPAVPLLVASGSTVGFQIVFEPSTATPVTGILAINRDTFTLAGVGAAPPRLPAVTLSGSGGAVGAAQQPAIGISLASPTTVDVAGTLSLEFSSEAFANDPAIQFATGGRTANFEIPANQTLARFPSGANQLLFQTGTVAGTIRISATFRSKNGSVDMTPSQAPELIYNVAQTAPQIREIAVTEVAANGFTVEVTGFATSRSVSGLAFQFSPVSGGNLQTTSVSADVTGPFRLWYQSSSSAGFGSQFTATVSFDVDGNTSAIQSVSATATNAQGTSPALSVDLRP